MPKIQKTEQEWRAELTPEQYHVLREKGTERAFTGEYALTKTPGVYRCAACGQELFDSDVVQILNGPGRPLNTHGVDISGIAQTKTCP